MKCEDCGASNAEHACKKCGSRYCAECAAGNEGHCICQGESIVYVGKPKKKEKRRR